MHKEVKNEVAIVLCTKLFVTVAKQINTQTVHVYAQLHKETLEEILPVVWIRPATLLHFVLRYQFPPTGHPS